MKKGLLAALCLWLVLALAGCATVNSENSFQSQAPAEMAAPTAVPAQAEPATQVEQPQAQPTAVPGEAPTKDPNAAGLNG